jgi:16S rRNA (guanine527-N7)-methyltransferase
MLDRFIALVLEWSARINLVASSTLPQLWTRHVADSLQLVDLAPNARVWVDLGSGGGFPGIPVACALAERPGAMVHLVESNRKKAAFLREAVRITGAPATVHAERVENFGDSFAGRADVVTARALAPLNLLLDQALPLLERGTVGLFPKGQDIEAELTEAAKYWSIQPERTPSRTSPQASILIVRSLARRSRPA